MLIVLHVLFLCLWFVCGVFLSFKILVHSNLSIFFLWIIIFEFSFNSYPLGHFSSKSVKVFFFNKCFQPPGSHVCLSCVVPNPFYFLYEFSHHLLNNPSISLWFVMPLLPHNLILYMCKLISGLLCSLIVFVWVIWFVNYCNVRKMLMHGNKGYLLILFSFGMILAVRCVTPSFEF